MSIWPIQVEVTNLFRSDRSGSWDVETAYLLFSFLWLLCWRGFLFVSLYEYKSSFEINFQLRAGRSSDGRICCDAPSRLPHQYVSHIVHCTVCIEHMRVFPYGNAVYLIKASSKDWLIDYAFYLCRHCLVIATLTWPDFYAVSQHRGFHWLAVVGVCFMAIVL